MPSKFELYAHNGITIDFALIS